MARRSILTAVLSGVVAMAACRPVEEASDAPPPADLAVRAVLDTLVTNGLARTGTPGAAVAVVEDGRVVAARGFGVANRDARAPFTAETRINVASVSKPITTLGVLRLIESGRLRLADPVNQRLTGWSVPSSGFDASGVTIERLLQHTAGLGMPSVPWFPVGASTPSLVEVLRGSTDTSGARLKQAPGAGWSYSGGGFAVLQLLIEDLTGLSFEDFMRQEVLGPLRMDSTSYGPHPGDASGYDEGGSPIPQQRYVGSSAAGLTTTATDFARLLQAYGEVWNGRSSVLEASTLRLVSGAPVPVVLDGVDGATYGLGHGVHVRGDGGVMLYHTGGNPGFRALFLVLPGSRSGLFAAVNSDQGVPVLIAVRAWWGERLGGDLPPLY